MGIYFTDSLCGIASGASCGLHQQGKQAFRRPEVAAEEAAVGVHSRHQGHASEVVPLGHHLGAHQHIHLAFMNRAQMRFQLTRVARGVGIDAQNPGRCIISPAQQRRQLLLEPLRATPQGAEVQIPAVRAGPGHPLGRSAMVTAQAAVDLVEDLPGAAVGASALPGAGRAVQHRRVAPAVEQQQALLAPIDAFLDCRHQTG